DATPESLAQDEALAQVTPATTALLSLRDELQAEERALDEERRGAQAAISDSESRLEQAKSAADLAKDEAERLLKLQRAGLVSDFELTRARKLADQRSAEEQSAGAASRLARRDVGTREQDRIVRIAALRAQIASLQGSVGQARATSRRLAYEIDRRVI